MGGTFMFRRPHLVTYLQHTVIIIILIISYMKFIKTLSNKTEFFNEITSYITHAAGKL